MKIRISIEYEVTDDKPELEKLGAEVIRAEADAPWRRSSGSSPRRAPR